ncbi:MAG: PQQ-binding-like beta-propeller repeat protein [Gemmatimonadetes bacterium]|nr:PQQ-binding-like beta-propeller repeat protein [Gemmatimonadota bacterium]
MGRNRFAAAVCGALAILVFTSAAFLGAQAPAAPQGAATPPAQPGAGRGGGIPGTETGWSTFQTQCAGCHGVVTRIGTAPMTAEIRAMTPERINAALQGKTHQGRTLSDIQARRVGEFMGGRPLGSTNAADAKDMPNQCRANPPMTDPAQSPGWNGWSHDLANTRFQTAAARLDAANVPKLTLKWAFGFPFGESNNAQPTIVSGRVFAASDNGYLYSLDAKTGCVYWSYQQGSIVRNSPTIGPVSGNGNARWAVFLGDGHAYVHAVDAQTGRQLWRVRVDNHPVARITAAVKYHEGRVYVPVSGSEEFSAGNIDYPCCTSRGAIVALDANTGKQIWATYNVGEPKPWKQNPNGVQLYGPSAGGIWAAPTIDPVRGALYAGTGDAVTPPESPLTDAVVAMDLKTGKVLWSWRSLEYDLFMGGCGGATRSEACPSPMGPDFDIGNSPILVTLADGRRPLLVGLKNADVVALDPDANGTLLFRVNPLGATPGATGRGGRGAIVWGGAASEGKVYYGTGARGVAAVQAATGENAWLFTAPGARGGTAGLGAAPTAIPGVVFEGATDGQLFAVNSADGTQLWQFNTAQDFDTVNKVTARGGAISTSGAVVVDGMVYVSSGYAIVAGASAGNVLLAFGTE